MQNNELDGIWQQINNGGSTHPKARSQHSMIVADNQLVMYGGLASTQLMNDCWTFNFETAQWNEMGTFGQVPTPSSDHSAIYWDKENTMVVFAGFVNRCKTVDTHLLNLRTREWKRMEYTADSELPKPVDGHSALYYKNQMIVFGGRMNNWVSTDAVFSLDLYQGRWTKINTTGNIPCARVGHSAIIHGDQMYVFGGYDDRGQFLGRHNDMHVLDLTTNVWTEIVYPSTQNVPVPLSCHKSALIELNDEPHMIVYGGWDDLKEFHDSTFVFNLNTHTWKKVATNQPIPKRRRCTALVPLVNAFSRPDVEGCIIFGGEEYPHMRDMWKLEIVNASDETDSETVSEQTNDPLDLSCLTTENRILSTLVHFADGVQLHIYESIPVFRDLIVANKQWDRCVRSWWKQLTLHRNAHNQFTINALLDNKLTPDLNEAEQTKEEWLLLQRFESFCDCKENLYWYNVPKIQGLASLLQIVNHSEIVMNFPSWHFVVAVFRTAVTEYPLVKVLLAYNSMTKQVFHMMPFLLRSLLTGIKSDASTQMFLDEIGKSVNDTQDQNAWLVSLAQLISTVEQGSQVPSDSVCTTTADNDKVVSIFVHNTPFLKVTLTQDQRVLLST